MDRNHHHALRKVFWETDAADMIMFVMCATKQRLRATAAPA